MHPCVPAASLPICVHCYLPAFYPPGLYSILPSSCVCVIAHWTSALALLPPRRQRSDVLRPALRSICPLFYQRGVILVSFPFLRAISRPTVLCPVLSVSTSHLPPLCFVLRSPPSYFAPLPFDQISSSIPLLSSPFRYIPIAFPPSHSSCLTSALLRALLSSDGLPSFRVLSASLPHVRPLRASPVTFYPILLSSLTFTLIFSGMFRALPPSDPLHSTPSTFFSSRILSGSRPLVLPIHASPVTFYRIHPQSVFLRVSCRYCVLMFLGLVRTFFS
ncbi:hypothetical protein C8R44DRAFT_892206 [Mycena epipterygia]|nr:hypothetical protein C8R44DRAFT_892206 [Mycena epipterygia]